MKENITKIWKTWAGWGFSCNIWNIFESHLKKLPRSNNFPRILSLFTPSDVSPAKLAFNFNPFSTLVFDRLLTFIFFPPHTFNNHSSEKGKKENLLCQFYSRLHDLLRREEISFLLIKKKQKKVSQFTHIFYADEKRKERI